MITTSTNIPPLISKVESDGSIIVSPKISMGLTNDSILIESYLKFNNSLNLILLDKFQGRSNISLILIQMKCDLQDSIKDLASFDKNISLNDPNFNSDKLLLLIKKQHSGLLYVFKRSHFWDIHELKDAYDQVFDGLPHCLKPTSILPFVFDGLDDPDLVLKLITSVHEGSEYAWGITLNDFNTFGDMILCCSESLDAFLDFEHGDSLIIPHIVDHHKISAIKHLLARSFLTSKQLKEHHDEQRSKSNNNDHPPKINESNLKIVQSPKFKAFNSNRLKVLAFDDKKVF